MACRSACATKDHKTYGQCLRAAGLRVGRLPARALSHNDRELSAYRAARDCGIQPDGTSTAKIDFAMRQSEQHGGRYGEDFRVAPRADGKGYDAVWHKDVKQVMGALPGDAKAIYEAAKTIPGSGVH